MKIKEKIVVSAALVDDPVVAAVEPMITFDRYFAILGRPARHKKGMIAFVKSINGRKTKEEWDRLFQAY